MTKEELIHRFNNREIIGDTLLNLPYYMTKPEIGRVLVEMYYLLLDTADGKEFSSMREVDRAIADALTTAWEYEMEED